MSNPSEPTDPQPDTQPTDHPGDADGMGRDHPDHPATELTPEGYRSDDADAEREPGEVTGEDDADADPREVTPQ